MTRRRTLELAPGCELRKDSAGRQMLIDAEGSVRLNEAAAAIFALCDGTRTGEEVIAAVLSAKNDALAGSLREFLDAATRRGWIVPR